MNTISQRLEKIRTLASLESPFFSSIFLRMYFKETDNDQALFLTDGRTIFYNRELLKQVSDSEALYVFLATVCHVVLKHHIRAYNKNPELWDKSTDFAVGDILKEVSQRSISISVPREQYIIDDFAGDSAEIIYEKLMDDQDKNPSSGSSGESGESGESDESNESGELGESGESSPDNKYKSGLLPPQNSLDEEEQYVNSLVVEAYNKARGNVPSYFKRELDELLESKIPWYQVLKPFLRFPVKSKITWARQNRKFIDDELYLPHKSLTKTGKIVVVIDTSGSISDKEYKEFASELNEILLDVNPSETLLIHCDAVIQHVETLPHNTLPTLEKLPRHGCGGTDFRPPFSYLEKEEIRPDALVYLTDTGGPFPEQPDYPVIWVSSIPDGKVPFGELIFMG